MMQENPLDFEDKKTEENRIDRATRIALEKERVGQQNRDAAAYGADITRRIPRVVPVYEELRTGHVNERTLEKRDLDSLIPTPPCGGRTAETTDTLLAQRGKTYGNFAENAFVSRQLKQVIGRGNTQALTPSMEEALDNICQKISRIITGDAYHADSWADVAGYARLVEKQLIEPKEK